MLTLFTTPKPFRGHIGIIQRNALRSWSLLHPEIEVILFGDEEGAAEATRELGIRHEPRVERSEHGTKYLPHLFRQAQQLARHELLCYSNCDILFTPQLTAAVRAVAAWRRPFLMAGRRWDVDITAPWDFHSPAWQEDLLALARQSGRQRPPQWIDYFAFPRGLFDDLPPLVIGRVGWDNYLLWRARAAGAPLVDASAVVVAVHQNHDYAYHSQGEKGVWSDQQARRNIALAGGSRRLFTLDDATNRLTPAGIEARWAYRWAPHRRAALRNCFRVWHAFLAVTRPLRHPLGLRQETLAGLLARIKK